MTAPTRYPAEYAAFRRQVRVATIQLGPDHADSDRLEATVADAMESFAATTGLADGTRSKQIVSWSRVFAIVVGQVSREVEMERAA